MLVWCLKSWTILANPTKDTRYQIPAFKVLNTGKSVPVPVPDSGGYRSGKQRKTGACKFFQTTSLGNRTCPPGLNNPEAAPALVVCEKRSQIRTSGPVLSKNLVTESQLPSSHSPNHCQLPVTHYRDPNTVFTSKSSGVRYPTISYFHWVQLLAPPSLGTNFVEQVPRTWSKVSFVR
jgi:hypothetical protein